MFANTQTPVHNKPTTSRLNTVCLLVLTCSLSIGCGNGGDDAILQSAKKREREKTAASRQKTTRSFEEQIQFVNDELAGGRLGSAELALKPLLITDPDHGAVIFASAKCLALRSDLRGAIRTLQSMPDDDQTMHIASIGQTADWFLALGMIDESISALQQIISRYGYIDLAHRKLSEQLNQQGRRIEAAKQVMQLVAHGDAREMELFSIVSLAEPFLAANNDDADANNLHQARDQYQRNLLQEAITTGKRCLTEQPGSSVIPAFLCRVLVDAGSEDELSELLANCSPDISNEPEYWFALGQLCQRSNRPRESIRAYCESALRDPTNRFVYVGLAQALETIGEPNEAASQRYTTLNKVRLLANEFAQAPGTVADLRTMAGLLKSLKRPIEAWGWERIALLRERAAKDKLEAWQLQMTKLVASAAPAPTEWLLCGLTMADWPLPKVSELPKQNRSNVAEADTVAFDTAVHFEDVAGSVGLNFKYISGDDIRTPEFKLHNMTGGGIGVIDYDNDGWPDVYMAQGGTGVQDASGGMPDQLFRNLQGKAFANATTLANVVERTYAQGVTAADINQDGFMDLLIANFGQNVFLKNNGDGSFQRYRMPVDENDNLWTTSIATGDLTGDHLPEIFEVNYIDDPKVLLAECTPRVDRCQPSLFRPAQDRLLQVSDDGTFKVMQNATTLESPGRGYAAVIADFDGKIGNDVFVANDATTNHFWTQARVSAATPAPGLIESGELQGCAFGLVGAQQGCMGIAAGDFDRSGKLDLHVTNYWNQPADVFLMSGNGFFTHGAHRMGMTLVSRRTVGWGTQATDIDRDGWLDIAVMNGHVTDMTNKRIPYEMKPQLFLGSPKGFALQQLRSIGDFWYRPTLGRTLAKLDWNRDGRIDFVAGHLDVPVSLVQNNSDIGNWLRLDLVGTKSEREAIGAEIHITSGEQTWMDVVTGGDGFLCTNEPTIDFGLGNKTQVDVVEIRWPSGETETLSQLAANHEYLIVEGSSLAVQLE